MKKISAWLLVIVLMLLTVGCAAEVPGETVGSGNASVSTAPVSPEEPKKPETTTPAESEVMPAPAEPEKVTYAVEWELLEKNIYAANGTKLAEMRCRLPLLQAVGEDGAVIAQGTSDVRARALEVTAAFNERFDSWREENDTLKMYAESGYQDNPDFFTMGMYYADGLDFSLWQTDRLISLWGNSYSYYGGAHPNTAFLGWNFDLLDGTYVNALSMGHDQQEFRAVVAEELIEQAQDRAVALQQEPTSLYWEDYRAILQNWNDYPVSFDDTGMTVRFSPYELGSYAAGAHEFTIGYEFLDPYLGDYGRELLGRNSAA